MLIISLIGSGLLLLALHRCADLKGSFSAVMPACLLILGGMSYCMIVLPALILHALLTFVAGSFCIWLDPRPRTFMAVTVGAFVLAYLGVGIYACWDLADLKSADPLVSMDERLAYENNAAPEIAPVALADDVRLISVAGRPAESTSKGGLSIGNFAFGGSERRQKALQKLHEGQVQAFVDSPGFGIGRGLWPLRAELNLPEESGVQLEPLESASSSEVAASPSLAGGQAALEQPTLGLLESLQNRSLLDFAFPQGYGYVKDRQHVYGFRPHRFSEDPSKGMDVKPWRLRELELLSLLRHRKPVVYLSESLPRMSELRGASAPVREPDPFEAAALPRLAKGDELVVHATEQRLRVLGAVRAGEACLECHSGKEGTLLGAFSYLLDRR